MAVECSCNINFLSIRWRIHENTLTAQMYNEAANGRPLLRHCPLSFKRAASPISPMAFEARSKLLITSSSRRNALQD